MYKRVSTVWCHLKGTFTQQFHILLYKDAHIFNILVTGHSVHLPLPAAQRNTLSYDVTWPLSICAKLVSTFTWSLSAYEILHSVVILMLFIWIAGSNFSHSVHSFVTLWNSSFWQICCNLTKPKSLEGKTSDKNSCYLLLWMVMLKSSTFSFYLFIAIARDNQCSVSVHTLLRLCVYWTYNWEFRSLNSRKII